MKSEAGEELGVGCVCLGFLMLVETLRVVDVDREGAILDWDTVCLGVTRGKVVLDAGTGALEVL